jgi:branched-chain amino acid transport system permease protein
MFHARGSILRIVGGSEIAAGVLFALTLGVPLVTDNLFVFTVLNQILIAAVASLSVYLMLRVGLLTFATPAFMAIGGYTVAIASLAGLTDVIVLTLASFVLPALVALPLGALILRLRGTYFVLVTFVLTEILQLFIFVTPAITGGSNGIAGIPALDLFGASLADNRSVLQLAGGLAVLAALITVFLTRYFRQQFAAIEENEVLAQSLGLIVWRYNLLAFAIAAGVAGLAGFSLVNMLLTAHPSSFTAVAAVDYIAYAIIGGRTSILGPVIGSGVLVTASNFFGGQGQYSQGLYGLLIIAVVLIAKGGIVGTVGAFLRRLRSALPSARHALRKPVPGGVRSR